MWRHSWTGAVERVVFFVETFAHLALMKALLRYGRNGWVQLDICHDGAR